MFAKNSFRPNLFVLCVIGIGLVGFYYLCFVIIFFANTNSKLNVEKPQQFISIKNITAPTNNEAFIEFSDSDLSNFDQKDPNLIKYVGSHYIIQPSILPYPSNVTNLLPNGMIQNIWPILKKISDYPKKGFFVEAGAYDGVSASNTIWLEQYRGWAGLLVECHPQVLPLLLKVNRKAFVSNACLSRSSNPTMAELTSVDGWHPSSSLISDKSNFPAFAKTFTKFNVQTIPLYTLLAALNVTTIDFISLDVQGLEIDVLKHFPFELILVKAWLIEVESFSKEEITNLTTLMQENDFSGPSKVSEADQLFIHKSVLHKLL